jgi:hypothetical protein
MTPFKAMRLRSVSDLTALSPTFTGANITLSNGNRTATRDATGSPAWRSSLTERSNSSGKRYFEVLIDQNSASTPFIIIGIAKSSISLTNFIGADADGFGYYRETGTKVNAGAVTAYGAVYAQGDRVGVAVDFDAGRIWFAKNNTWQASGDPVAGTNAAFGSGIAGLSFKAGVSVNTGTGTADRVTIATVTSQLNYAPPSGFAAWNA